MLTIPRIAPFLPQNLASTGICDMLVGTDGAASVECMETEEKKLREKSHNS
jgi:hypothetical protein